MYSCNIVSMEALSDSESEIALQTPPRKKPKRQCHFDTRWMKEFEGICRISKGKQYIPVKIMA